MHESIKQMQLDGAEKKWQFSKSNELRSEWTQKQGEMEEHMKREETKKINLTVKMPLINHGKRFVELLKMTHEVNQATSVDEIITDKY